MAKGKEKVAADREKVPVSFEVVDYSGRPNHFAIYYGGSMLGM